MKFVRQYYEVLEQEIPMWVRGTYKEDFMISMYKHIERCGRICYKSLDKITENSASKFVQSLINSGHYSVLEHGAVYLLTDDAKLYHKYNDNKYSYVNFHPDGYAISTNYRVIIENHWEDDLKYLWYPTDRHERRYTVLLHACIHVYKDLTRHRKMSFSIESTRYCNYNKDKFGSELKFVELPWCPKLTIQLEALHSTLQKIETTYLNLINEGWQAQQAAEVLPQCTAADVVMSGFSTDWEFVFALRSNTALTGQPHPLVKELMEPLKKEFIDNKYIKDIDKYDSNELKRLLLSTRTN